MSRSISIEELNKRIDRLISECEACEKEEIENRSKGVDGIWTNSWRPKIEILNELKIDLNDPEAVEDITENVQQTLNVIETKKIIDNEL